MYAALITCHPRTSSKEGSMVCGHVTGQCLGRGDPNPKHKRVCTAWCLSRSHDLAKLNLKCHMNNRLF